MLEKEKKIQMLIFIGIWWDYRSYDFNYYYNNYYLFIIQFSSITCKNLITDYLFVRLC